MKNKKIIFFSNFLSPYQLDFLNELSNFGEIKVVFNDKKTLNTNWKIQKKKNFFYISNFKKKKREFFYKDLLNSYNPDVILLGGYRLRDIFIIARFFLKKNAKIFFFLEKPKNNFYIGLALKKIYLYIFFKILNVSGIFAVGENAKKYYQHIFKNVYNLPYSINGKEYKRAIFPKKIKKIKFIFIGQLIERKNISLLLKSFKILNNSNYKNKLELTIIGKGPMIQKVKQLSKKYSNLKHYGFMNQTQLKKMLFKQHILVLPSKIEGWGVVINQAMASGLALIINKNMEIYKDFFKDGINGLSIDNTSESLIQNMIYLINNYNKIKIMGKNNFQYFFKSKLEVKHSVKHFISKI